MQFAGCRTGKTVKVDGLVSRTLEDRCVKSHRRGFAMPTSEVIQIARELILTALLLTLPVILVSLVVGLAISLFQTVTSIQEQTLSFAPRIVAVAVVTVLALPWSLNLLTGFTVRMMWRMTEAAR